VPAGVIYRRLANCSMSTDGTAGRPFFGITSRTLRAFGQTLCFDGAGWRWTDDGSIEPAAVSMPLSAFVIDLTESITRYGQRAVVIFPDRLHDLAPDVRSVVADILQKYGRQMLIHNEQHQPRAQGFVVDGATWERETARVHGVWIPNADKDRILDRAARIVSERERVALTMAAQERVRRLTDDEPFRTIAGLHSDRLVRNYTALERHFVQTLDEGSPAFLAACERAFAEIAAPGGSDFLLFDASDCIAMAAHIVARIKRGG